MRLHEFFRFRSYSWKINLERRALPGLAVNADAALVLGYDSVHGGESEARSLPNALRGEERLEDFRFDAFFDAATGVAYRQDDVSSSLGTGVLGNVTLVQFSVRRLHHDLA